VTASTATASDPAKKPKDPQPQSKTQDPASQLIIPKELADGIIASNKGKEGFYKFETQPDGSLLVVTLNKTTSPDSKPAAKDTTDPNSNTNDNDPPTDDEGIPGQEELDDIFAEDLDPNEPSNSPIRKLDEAALVLTQQGNADPEDMHVEDDEELVFDLWGTAFLPPKIGERDMSGYTQALSDWLVLYAPDFCFRNLDNFLEALDYLAQVAEVKSAKKHRLPCPPQSLSASRSIMPGQILPRASIPSSNVT
jgi:hypothetical protein